MGLSRKAKRARRSAGHDASDLKMSEVLVDLALPLLRGVPGADNDDYEMTYKLVAALWNASRVPNEEVRAKVLAELMDMAEDEAEAAELEALFRQVIARAERLYPRLDRLIERVEVIPLPGERYTVRVFSS